MDGGFSANESSTKYEIGAVENTGRIRTTSQKRWSDTSQVHHETIVGTNTAVHNIKTFRNVSQKYLKDVPVLN
jgi:hypothetical protein